MIGSSLTRVDALPKVTGEATYMGTFAVPGMLYGKLLRSQVAHARVLNVDASRAKRVPGVVAVLTRDDLEGLDPYFGPVYRDQGVVAIDKVRFVGDILAAVAAVDEDTAEEALELIDVDLEELPAVFDAREAMQPGAPLIHETVRLPRNPFYDVKVMVKRLEGTNICNHLKLRHGNVEEGFAQSDFIFEDEYSVPSIQHCPMETHAVVAQVTPDRCVTVWSCTQNAHTIRSQLAEIFRVPESKVRVIVPYLGGGYGAKVYPKLEPVTAALAWKAGRPVKIRIDREEEFLTVTSHAVRVRIKTGVKKDGTFVARKVESIFDTGAYADIGPRTSKNAGYASGGPYRFPHVWLDAYCVYTNNPPAGALRGFGVPQVAWAYESHLDRIARELGIDPLELRLKNILREGDEFATGERMHSVGYEELLKRVSAAISWGVPSDPPSDPKKRRGKGLACVIKSTITPSSSSAAVKISEDGSVNVLVSSVEMGQGSDTVMTQIAAQELGVSPDRIKVTKPDTDATPFDLTTSSSRTTFSVGNALILACQDAKNQLLANAAELLEVPVHELEYREGRIVLKQDPSRGVSLDEAVRGKGATRGAIVGRGTFTTTGGTDPETAQGKASVFWFQSAAGAEVEVDTETGAVKILKLCVAVDGGKAVNPKACEQQNEGSAIWGIGRALMEEMVLEKGQVTNGTFVDYKIPSFRDLPEVLETCVVETPHREGPYGAKGLGEAGVPPVAPAIANAVCDAVGVRIKDLPLTPEKVLRALKEKERADKGGA